MNNTGIKERIYSVAAQCVNCGHRGFITRDKGQSMPEKDVCPNCRCSTFEPQRIFGAK